MKNNDLKGEGKDISSKPYTLNPWSLYDRVNSVKLSNVNGEDGKDVVYQGIVIGQRQIMGIKDSFVIPIVASLIIVGLGFSFVKFFIKEDKTNGTAMLNPNPSVASFYEYKRHSLSASEILKCYFRFSKVIEINRRIEALVDEE